jgi:hypothetical protein
MPWSVTLAGTTFTHANVEGNAYADEATGLPAILQAVAEEASAFKGVHATSSSPLTAAVGPVTFTTDQSAATTLLRVGDMVRAASASDLTVWMIGAIAGFTGTSLTITATLAGSGAMASDWLIGPPYLLVKNLALDPAPRLSAALDAGGYAITNTANLQSYAVSLGAAYAIAT